MTWPFLTPALLDLPMLRSETTQQQIEDAFTSFTTRDDVAVLLVNQSVRG